MPGTVPQTATTRKKTLVLALLTGVGVLLLASGSGRAADKNHVASARVKRGDAIFHQRCVICHNKQPGDDAPFGPPNLYDQFKQKNITAAQATQIIRHGKNRMPSFATVLTAAQIQDVLAYLQHPGS